ncbi:hypothetical protein RIF29_10280 [Crotalaria pallida]|uniref:TF-B3 domain-containing protein n=1 Tax=Crotalaria pallida TaxID=3830 RepID=A0AAN9FYU0_CROPI
MVGKRLRIPFHREHIPKMSRSVIEFFRKSERTRWHLRDPLGNLHRIRVEFRPSEGVLQITKGLDQLMDFYRIQTKALFTLKWRADKHFNLTVQSEDGGDLEEVVYQPLTTINVKSKDEGDIANVANQPPPTQAAVPPGFGMSTPIAIAKELRGHRFPRQPQVLQSHRNAFRAPGVEIHFIHIKDNRLTDLTSALPSDLVDVRNGNVPSTITIRLENGSEWPVEVVRCGAKYYFGSGWNIFITANKLDKDQALV